MMTYFISWSGPQLDRKSTKIAIRILKAKLKGDCDKIEIEHHTLNIAGKVCWLSLTSDALNSEYLLRLFEMLNKRFNETNLDFEFNWIAVCNPEAYHIIAHTKHYKKWAPLDWNIEQLDALETLIKSINDKNSTKAVVKEPEV